jgi:hypothetical protein
VTDALFDAIGIGLCLFLIQRITQTSGFSKIIGFLRRIICRRYIAAFVSKLSDAETEACPVKYIDRHLTGQQKRKFGLKWHFDLVI